MSTSVEAVIEEHLPLARRAANRYLKTLPNRYTFDDLYADALVGLWKAAIAWDPEGGANFRNYAWIRMKGAMVDGLRDMDEVPRSMRVVDADGFKDIAGYVQVSPVISSWQDFYDNVFPDGHSGIDEMFEEWAAQARLEWIQETGIQLLTASQRYVLMRQMQGAVGREIAEEMNITESRVSQIRVKSERILRRAAQGIEWLW